MHPVHEGEPEQVEDEQEPLGRRRTVERLRQGCLDNEDGCDGAGRQAPGPVRDERGPELDAARADVGCQEAGHRCHVEEHVHSPRELEKTCEHRCDSGREQGRRSNPCEVISPGHWGRPSSRACEREVALNGAHHHASSVCSGRGVPTASDSSRARCVGHNRIVEGRRVMGAGAGTQGQGVVPLEMSVPRTEHLLREHDATRRGDWATA
jgi:hypothetical protein